MLRPDAGDAVGNGDARQASAATECVIPDAGDAVGNGDARQAVQLRMRNLPMLVTLLGMVMLVRHYVPVVRHTVGIPMLVTCRDGDARQASAAIECAIPDAGDAVGNGDARQAAACIECAIPMLGVALGIVMLVCHASRSI